MRMQPNRPGFCPRRLGGCAGPCWLEHRHASGEAASLVRRVLRL